MTPDGVHRHHARMAHRRERLCFVLYRRRIHVRPRRFDRDTPIEDAIGRLEHLPHTAFAEPPADLVHVAHDLPRREDVARDLATGDRVGFTLRGRVEPLRMSDSLRRHLSDACGMHLRCRRACRGDQGFAAQPSTPRGP